MSSTIPLPLDDCLIYKNNETESDTGTLQEDRHSFLVTEVVDVSNKSTVLWKKNVVTLTYMMLGTNFKMTE